MKNTYTISEKDLQFLVYLENRLGDKESWSKDVCRLWKLNEKLVRQKRIHEAAGFLEKQPTIPTVEELSKIFHS